LTLKKNLLVGLGLVALLAIPLAAAYSQKQRDQGLPPLPSQPAAAQVDLVYARPFTLEVPATHWWRVEQPSYDAGWILVLEATNALVEPRQTFEPVLYVGDQTAERVNAPWGGNRVVAVVPSTRAEGGGVALDLKTALIFFGTPALPEQVDAAAIAAELARAARRGQGPHDWREMQAALQAGGPLIALEDRVALDEELANVIEAYAPDERDTARGLRAR
jgi:hypothetical protein